jgi:hypothetical protein
VAIVAGNFTAGYQFNGWTGTGVTAGKVANPALASTTITMDADYTVIANSVLIETVSTPTAVAGPATGDRDQSLSFTASGSVSNLGHTPIEYRFDWGDGTAISGYSAAAQTHSYATAGVKNIKAQARCQLHPAIESAWSGNLASVTITCMSVSHVDYSNWVTVGRPASWCWLRQCHGDANNATEPFGRSGSVWVGYVDIGIMTAAFRKAPADPAYNVAPDFDRRAEAFGRSGTVRVGYNDVNVLLWHFRDAHGVPPADCLNNTHTTP